MLDCADQVLASAPSVEHEGRLLRDEFLPILAKLRNRYDAIPAPKTGQGSEAEVLRELRHCHYLRTVALGCFVGTVLNYIITMSGGGTFEIVEESELYVEEIISLARAASRYRPLGACALSICLTGACAVSNNADTRAIAEELRLEYDKDFVGVDTYHLSK